MKELLEQKVYPRIVRVWYESEVAWIREQQERTLQGGGEMGRDCDSKKKRRSACV